jgi:hypothetical protein
MARPTFLMRSLPIQLGKFAADNALRIAVISLIMVTPCFWHRYIEAGDLGSHLYNAWLVQLIHAGKAPGLWIGSQWNNVLFDWLLGGCLQAFGLGSADKIAAAFCALLFFWGAFALATALTRRPPWLLSPALAMITYGWTFNMGFFNFYLSIALSFWALAILASAEGWCLAVALPLLVLTYVAHPLGFAWAAGAGFYITLARRLSPPRQWLLVLAAAAVLVGAHFFVWSRYPVVRPLYLLYYTNGADQILLRKLYRLPAAALFLFGAFVIVRESLFEHRENRPDTIFSIPAQLYLVSLIAVWTLPNEITLPQYSAPLKYILERFSLVSAGVACCMLAMARRRLSDGIFLSVIAAVYFSFLYHDTAVLNRTEAKIVTLLESIGPNQRVVGNYRSGGPDSRLKYNQMLDRECTGKCYSLENYEPLSGQFRVHAEPDSPILATPREVPGITGSQALVQIAPKYFPVYEFYLRSNDPNDIAMRVWKSPDKPD